MKITIYIFLFLFIIIQLIRPDKSVYKYDSSLALKTPNKVEHILKKACYDCHSDKIVYPWYFSIAPMSWTIKDHIVNGRKAINFSRWNEIPKDIKIKRVKRAIKTVYIEMMPLPSYTWIHDDAVLTKEEKEILDKYFKELLKTL